MKRMIIALIASLLIAGCTSGRACRNLSSGVIGCPANQIIIKNETASFGGMHNWTAICNEKTYICSYQETTGVNCSSSLNVEEIHTESIGGL